MLQFHLYQRVTNKRELRSLSPFDVPVSPATLGTITYIAPNGAYVEFDDRSGEVFVYFSDLCPVTHAVSRLDERIAPAGFADYSYLPMVPPGPRPKCDRVGCHTPANESGYCFAHENEDAAQSDVSQH